jgi:hypothetical protein
MRNWFMRSQGSHYDESRNKSPSRDKSKDDTIIVTHFQVESFPFAGKIWDDVIRLLGKRRPQERLKHATLNYAIAIVKAFRHNDFLPPILGCLVVLLGPRNNVDMTIHCVARIVHLLSNEQSVGLFRQVLAQCRKSTKRDICAECLSTLAKFVKHAKGETLLIVLPKAAKFSNAAFTGRLSVLAEKSLNDDGCSITAEFFELLSGLSTEVVKHTSDIVASRCEYLFALLARPEDTHRSMTRGVMISAVESVAGTDALYEALVAAVPSVVE